MSFISEAHIGVHQACVCMCCQNRDVIISLRQMYLCFHKREGFAVRCTCLCFHKRENHLSVFLKVGRFYEVHLSGFP